MWATAANTATLRAAPTISSAFPIQEAGLNNEGQLSVASRAAPQKIASLVPDLS